MSLSMLYEQWSLLSGSLKNLSIMSIEWLLAAALFIYLLYRFTRRRSALYTAEEGFTYGQGWCYATAVSLACGLIVGVVNYLYRCVIVGNGEYIRRLAESMQQTVLENVPPAMSGLYAGMLKDFQEAAAPSIFSMVSATLFSYFFVGGLVGLIIAGIVSREAKPFGDGADGE